MSRPASSQPCRPGGTRAGLRTEVLGVEAAEGRLGEAWLRLALGVEGSTCFMLPAWFQTWHRVLSEGDEAHVLAVHDGDALVGVLPLMQARVWRGPSCAPRIDYAPADRVLSPGGRRLFPLRQLASVASWPAASLRPTLLCAKDDRPAVTAAMAVAMRDLPGVDAIVLPVYVGEDAAQWTTAFRAAGGRPWLHELNRSVLTLDAVRPFDAVVADQNKKFRQNVRRARATAENLGVALAVHEGSDAVAARLELVARVARESWKHTGRGGQQITLPYEGRQRAFFESLLAEEGTGLTPVLVTATAEGEAIAVLLAVRHAATMTALVTFRDDRCAAASPGLLLLGRLLDWAAEQGLRRFDINATQDWVRHLSDRRQVLANLIVFAPTLRGGGYALVSRAARWMHRWQAGAGEPGERTHATE